MIITLMLIGFIIVGIILLTISKSDKINIGWSKRDTCEFIGMLLIVMGIVASLFACGFAISNAVTYDLNYQNALYWLLYVPSI